MRKELNSITLAAFLHDVGKLYQRCGDEKLTQFNESYCPEYKGHISHIHAGFTAQFFDKKGVQAIFESYEISKDANERIRNIAAYHHKPSNFYEWIVASADRLASGFEREKFTSYENLTAEEEKQQFDYKKARLISIFSRIMSNPNLKYYEIKKLSPDIFPIDLTQKQKEEAEREYQNLRDDFENDLNKLNNEGNFNNFYNALLTLFEKYFWCIPSSSFNTLADVSLFDHMKTTASIATTLFVYHKEKGDTSTEILENYSSDEKKFVLVQGDFSGIQDFIFSKFGESNKYMAKILRAKSFYVSIFTEIAAYLIINEFKTNSSSIILNAGGKFTLLLPKINNHKEKINKIKEEINDYFAKINYCQTLFNIAFTELSGKDFTEGRFGEKLKELSHKLAIDKLKPEIKSPVFKEYLSEVSKAEGVCSIDGFRPKDNGDDYSLLSKMFMKIGAKLPKSNFINIYFSNNGEFQLFENKITFNLSLNPEKDADLIFKINPDENFTGYAEKMLAYYVPTFTKEDLKSAKYTEISEKVFDETDFKEGGIKTFFHIAADSKNIIIDKNEKEKFKGKNFLGILKADIDNLGNIFSKGFDNVNIAKISSLSRMLDYFFTAWLPKTIKEKYKSIYTVFAGGDDLFLIGAYNQIVDLSKEISQHLKKYVAENPNIHISAGIILKKPQVPVYQMAEEAENTLEISKQNKGKNSVTLFDVTVKWEEYFKLLDYCKKIDEFFEKGVSTGYIYNILKYIEMAQELKKGKLYFGKRRNALWIAHLNYNTVRNYKDEKLKVDLLNFFYSNIQDYGEKLIIPISLSLYKRRN